MALSMSGIISLALTAIQAGPSPELLVLWPRQWAMGFAVALPTALVMVPVIRNGLARVTVASGALTPPPHSPTGRRTP